MSIGILSATTSCYRSPSSPGESYLLTTNELESLLESANSNAMFGGLRVELLHREIQPNRGEELANQIIAAQTQTVDAASLTVAWAKKSLNLTDKNEQELSKRYAVKAADYAESCPDEHRVLAAACYAKARYLYRNRRWEKSYLEYRKLLRLSESREDCADYVVRARNGLGSVALVQGAMVRARHYFLAAMEQEMPPSLAEAKVFPAVNIGILAWRNGQYEKAINFLQRALPWTKNLEKSEWIAEIHRGTTVCNLELGRLEEAAESLSLAKAHLDQASTNRKMLLDGLHILVDARLERESKEQILDSADQWLAKFDKEEPTYRSALALHGQIAAALDRPKIAIETFEKILTMKPDKDLVHQILALQKIAKIHVAAEETEAAARTLQRLNAMMQRRYASQLSSEFNFSNLESKIDAQVFAEREKRLSQRGSRLKYWLMALSLLAGGGATLGLLTVRHARWRRLFAESEKEQSFHEKEELATRLESTLQQKRRLEALGELTGGVAHDFNNLLTVIMNSNELLMLRLRENQDSDELIELVSQSLNASELAADITQQLLAFGRKQPLHPEIVDLSTLLTSIEGLLLRTISPLTDLKIILPDRAEKPLVKIDRPQLITALINLCSNSRDAVKENKQGRVEIELKTQNKVQVAGFKKKYHEIIVSDNGCGMTPLEIQRACEPFFTTKDKTSGVGLGLSTVHGFIIQSGGELQIESEVGKFTKVRFLLPAAKNEQSDTTTRRLSSKSKLSSVLIVDDDQHIRDNIKRILALDGIDSTLASDSEQAKRLLESGVVPDLVLSDIRMKTATEGIDFANWLAAQHPTIRVMLISGYYDSEGAEGFEVIRKPFSRSTLSAAIGLS